MSVVSIDRPSPTNRIFLEIIQSQSLLLKKVLSIEKEKRKKNKANFRRVYLASNLTLRFIDRTEKHIFYSQIEGIALLVFHLMRQLLQASNHDNS